MHLSSYVVAYNPWSRPAVGNCITVNICVYVTVAYLLDAGRGGRGQQQQQPVATRGSHFGGAAAGRGSQQSPFGQASPARGRGRGSDRGGKSSVRGGAPGRGPGFGAAAGSNQYV